MKYLTLALVLFCGHATANPFTYDVQRAGYKFDQYDQKGNATFEKFKEEFRGFQWKDQVGKSNGGTEPTISVKNSDTNISLWVSVLGTSDEYAYLVGIVQPKKTKNILGKEKEVSWVSAYVLEKAEWVEEAFQLYFDGETHVLNNQLTNLPLLFEQAAEN